MIISLAAHMINELTSFIDCCDSISISLIVSILISSNVTLIGLSWMGE